MHIISNYNLVKSPIYIPIGIPIGNYSYNYSYNYGYIIHVLYYIK